MGVPIHVGSLHILVGRRRAFAMRWIRARAPAGSSLVLSRRNLPLFLHRFVLPFADTFNAGMLDLRWRCCAIVRNLFALGFGSIVLIEFRFACFFPAKNQIPSY